MLRERTPIKRHTVYKLILSTYFEQNDGARLVAETSKINFGLGLPKTT